MKNCIVVTKDESLFTCNFNNINYSFGEISGAGYFLKSKGYSPASFIKNDDGKKIGRIYVLRG